MLLAISFLFGTVIIRAVVQGVKINKATDPVVVTNAQARQLVSGNRVTRNNSLNESERIENAQIIVS